MARIPHDPPALIAGDPVLTPDGLGIFLGTASYEVTRLGVHAGQRRYIWTDPRTRVSCTLEGPFAVELVASGLAYKNTDVRGAPLYGSVVRGYTHDQLAIHTHGATEKGRADR